MELLLENRRLIGIGLGLLVLFGGLAGLKWWIQRLASSQGSAADRAIAAALKKHGALKAARVALEHHAFAEAADLFAQEGRRLDEARAWRRAEQWDKAADAFSKAKDWDSAAFCYGKAGDDHGAVKALANAGQFESAAQAAMRLGRRDQAADLLVKAGKESEAVELYRKAGATDRALELSAGIRERRGEWAPAAKTWIKLERWDDALRCFHQANDVSAAAKVLIKLQRQDEAVDLLTRAAKHAEVAPLLEGRGQFKEAATHWQRADQLDRALACLTKAGDRVGVFKLRVSRQEHTEALRVADSISPTDPHYAEVIEQAVHIGRERGESRETLMRLERLLRVPVTLGKRDELTQLALTLCVEQGQAQLGRVLLERLGEKVDLSTPEFAWAERRRQQLFDMPAAVDPIPIHGQSGSRQAAMVSGAVMAEATSVFSESTIAYVEGEEPNDAVRAFGVSIDDDGWPNGVPPSLAARYSELERLGQGGNGVVFKAQDKLLDRVVVLKFMIDGAMPSEMARKYFNREVKMAASLSHPNIVHIYDMGSSDDVPWYSMEFIDGLPLSAHMPVDGPIEDVGFGLSVVEQIAGALDHAHGKGMIHRDIKPDNILVAHDGQAKLLDFGLARAFDDSFGEQSVLAGTPFYMAPEQIDGTEANHKIDIYAMGVILYRMFTGRLPFLDGNIFVAHAMQPVPDLKQFNAELPDDAAAVIKQCMAKSAAERPETCVEVASRLRKAFS